MIKPASFILILFGTSCTKSYRPAVSATLSGRAFSSTQSQAFYSSSHNAFVMAGWVNVNGDSALIELDLDGKAALGAPVSFADGLTVSYADSKQLYSYSGDRGAGHGSVTITIWDKVNNRVAGTFTGVLRSDDNPTDTLVVSGGQFSIAYQAVP